jgi:hypothetical protein
LEEFTESQVTEELKKTSEEIWKAVGYRPIYFRAPAGYHGTVHDSTRTVDDIARELGMSSHIDWGPDTHDYYNDSDEEWKKHCGHEPRCGALSQHIVTTIKEASDGAIILCHESFEHTPEALQEVLPELKANPEYCFKTLAEHPNYQDKAKNYRETVYRYHKVDKGLTCFYYSTNSKAEPGWTADGVCFKSAPFIPGARPVRQYRHEDSSHPLRYAYTIEPYSGNYGPGWTYDEKFAFYAFKKKENGMEPVYQYYQVIEGGYWNLFYSTKPNEPPQGAGWTCQGPAFYVYA